MSSPTLCRLSSSTSTSGGSTQSKGDLINAYEAEEERIMNILSRKLEEKLREEKITLENALEAEAESHVNRLNRELTLLRARQRGADEVEVSPTAQTLVSGLDPRFPTPEAMLDAMRRENESLRNKLVATEQDYVRISRLNEVYREELIGHRRRLGISVDNLVGLSGSATDVYSQPLHRRSASGSPTTSAHPLPSSFALRSALSGVPIPRPPSQLHRPNSSQPAGDDSSAATPLTTSPSPSPSPFSFSPVTNVHPLSYLSNATQITTPSSAAASLHATPPPPFPAEAPVSLSYPSVPPPSLSSSLGSPTFSYSQSHSPTDTRVSRNSRPCARVAEVGNLRDISRSRSRRGSLADSRSQSESPHLTAISPHSAGGGVLLQSPGNSPILRASSSHRVAETGSLSRTRRHASGSENES